MRREYIQGIVQGEYTINTNGDKVAFASGNLQYRASDNSWRFAEHQYDVIRNAPGNTTTIANGRTTQSDWIDLFGYGATGYNNGQSAYQPWAVDTNAYSYYNGNTVNTTADFSYPYNLQYGTTFRMLTNTEWSYVAFSRNGERFAKATVNGIEGLILLPDGVVSGLNQVNVATTQYNVNVISANEWGVCESKGFVFLPCGGYRGGTTVGQISGSIVSGFYRSSVQSNQQRAYYFQFKTGSTNSGVSIDSYVKSDGLSVRLVEEIS